MVVAIQLVDSSNFGAGKDWAVGDKDMPFRSDLVEEPPVGGKGTDFVDPALDAPSSSSLISVPRSPLLICR